MKKKNKLKIKPEAAWGIIGAVALIFLYFIVSASLNMPKVVKEQIEQAQKGAPKESANEARILFASNGQREIYKVQRADGKWVVIIDGQESAAYDEVDNAVFSQDGEHFAFSGKNGDEAEVVVDGQAQEGKFRDIVEIIFNQNGSKVAFVAVDSNGKSSVVVNGQSGKSFEQIGTLQSSNGESYIIFSQDGESYAYKVIEDGKTYLVVNGQQQSQGYFDIISFSFSPDGSQFTFTAINSSGQQVTVVNGQEIPASNSNPGSSTNTNNTTGSSNSSTSSKKYKGNRFKTDVNRSNSTTDYPECTGSGCNF